ncbi:MAG: hypothetical protein IJP16_00580, partial [Clostridia bacterium]|nr:hypothetical protein [Clostridia bacterium]
VLLTVFFEKTVDFRSNECSPKSNLLFGEADISASKRLFAFSTSYIHYEIVLNSTIDKQNYTLTSEIIYDINLINAQQRKKE